MRSCKLEQMALVRTSGVAPRSIDSVWLDTRNAANKLIRSYSILQHRWGVMVAHVAVSQFLHSLEGLPIQQKIGDYITVVSDNTEAMWPTRPRSTSTERGQPNKMSIFFSCIANRGRRQRHCYAYNRHHPKQPPNRTPSATAYRHAGRRPRRDPAPRPARPTPGRDREPW